MGATQRSFLYVPQPAADPTHQLVLQMAGTRVLVAHRPHPGLRP